MTGRVRVSTVVLTVVFAAVTALYVQVRPPPASGASAVESTVSPTVRRTAPRTSAPSVTDAPSSDAPSSDAPSAGDPASSRSRVTPSAPSTSGEGAPPDTSAPAPTSSPGRPATP